MSGLMSPGLFLAAVIALLSLPVMLRNQYAPSVTTGTAATNFLRSMNQSLPLWIGLNILKHN